MITRFFAFIEREISGLHEAAYLLASFSIFSAILALVRDRAFASMFGAGEILDVYYAAFRIPDIMFVSVAMLVSASVLVPLLNSRTREEGKILVGNVLAIFSGLLVLVSTALFFVTPFFLEILFPNITNEVYQADFINLARLLLIQPVLLGISGILAGVSQANGRFIPFAVAPILYNFGIIGGLWWIYPHTGIIGLGYGVIIGAVLHLLIQIPFAWRFGYLEKLFSKIWWKEIFEMIFVSLPRALALSSQHLAFLGLISFAASIGTGAISVVSLAFNMQAAAVAMIGASYSMAAFPILSRLAAQGNGDEFLSRVSASARHILFWSLPIAALVIVLRAHIVRAVLGTGAFDWSDTRLTSAALGIFAASIVAQGLSLLYLRAHYAAGKTSAPFVINTFTGFLSVILGFLLIRAYDTFPVWQFFVEGILRVENVENAGVLMIPLAFTIGAFAGAIGIMFLPLARDATRTIGRAIFESASAAIILVAVAHYCLELVVYFFGDAQTLFGIIAHGSFAGAIGLASAIIVLALLGSRELKEAWVVLHHKFWKMRFIFDTEV